jgi:DNA topoisomerase-1
MYKNLVIVESPAKAKTIGQYLGKDYKIAASVGHIRDLPQSTLGVDVGNDFKPRYINMRGKHKVIKELKDLAENSENVLLATDPDREGEAIAWHLATILKIDPASDCRIAFNEITPKAVKHAVESPRPIDMDLVDAQQARRILDRLVGYELSPLLWKKIRKGLSAGRVQSVATRMLVEKERAIEAFKPEEYWHIFAELSKQSTSENFKVRYQGEKNGDKVKRVDISNKDEADALVKDLDPNAYMVDKVKKGQRKKHPKPPFTTSTLQQEASSRLGFTARRTMRVAQQLYEGVAVEGHGLVALVTYIRTDAVRISEEALVEAKKKINQIYGPDYALAKPRTFKNKNEAQDAHEAIRPAHFDLDPDSIRNSLTDEQFKLYDLIWKRFLASQMKACDLNTVSLDVANGTHIFRVNGETIIFPGYLKAYDDAQSGQSKERLPELEEGEKLDFVKLDPQQKFTQPPARYTEASLIKAMEEEGIGRPSTYAPTISTILDRHYAEKEGRSLKPTGLGVLVTEMLEENFENIVDMQFTAGMEDELDKVEAGKKDWVELLQGFYPDFHEAIEKADDAIKKVELPEEDLHRKCPKCKEGNLFLKHGRYGKFVACDRFPECDYTESYGEPTPSHCPKCGSKVVRRKSKRNRYFYTCDKLGDDPNCDFISWNLPLDGENCPTCGAYMVQKVSRGQTYKACSNPDCPTNQKKKTTKKSKTAKASKDTKASKAAKANENQPKEEADEKN